MKTLMVLSLISLMGCATAEKTAQSWEPFAVEIKQPLTYQIDLAACHQDALDYLNKTSKIDPLSVALQGAQGGLSNLSSLATAPVGVAFGGLGTGSDEAINELGLSSTNVKKVITICMYSKGQESGAYHIYDPLLLGDN